MVALPANSGPFGPSVLIADDNDGWRGAVDEVLTREGFRTVQARSGEEAVDLARAEPVDVALLDFHMPRLDGLETLRRIREFLDHLPAALMTGRPAEVPPAAVRSLRIEFVIEKPADRVQIVTVVTKLVGWGP
jgi:CheY-like chemotaxis protein